MMVNGRLPFFSVRQILKASPRWNPKLSIGERTDIDKSTNKASTEPVKVSPHVMTETAETEEMSKTAINV